ncbi:long-chain-fatty-acid--CoA ligase [Prauserella muralis]|uniref:Long-chain-fatty-acid--CoA ligase n=1 Tax=Prauserella muralis TaxID=588067 RepID=A0A2V4AH66_9PSEU|nr:long-chain fatty acid--CoA ligase [Prauserella muralis]PXY19262.1 long-chain-fatty-acid--CoA ligase [Prauserella muralis]TWE29196.1 long-chain acyl-CoA synthetase [Prauserella muralis]
MSFNLASILDFTAATDPDRPLLYVGDEALTFGHVDDRARRVAAGLTTMGLRPGDRVMIQLPNVAEFVYAYFAILKAGLTMVPVNPVLAPREVAYQITDSGATVLIAHASALASARAGARGAGGVRLVVVGGGAGPGELDFSALLEAAPADLSHATGPDDAAVVLYTSGTTGQPKGAELTHFQLYMNCTVTGELLGLGPGDVMTGVLPLFHVFGLSSVLNVAVRYGVPLVLMRRFSAEAVIDAIGQYRITVFSGVPTMYVALLHADVRGREVGSLRRGMSGGASMPTEVIRGIEEKYPGLVVLEGYGLSETASVASFNIDAEQRKVGSIGRPVWGIEMRVVDADGDECPPGGEHIGEITVRGHNVMKGYLGKPDDTAAAIRDGWFHTGDLGYRDEDGYFYVVDRLKDLIIRGGYNVYPREVEEVLYAHPDVVEAAVVGRPDGRLGEEIEAYVVLTAGGRTGVRDLDEHCRARLAAYKYPRSFHLVDELPKGATGKVLKRELRATTTRSEEP